MAQAAFTKENENFFRFACLLLDVGSEILREVFQSYYHPKPLKNYLAETQINNKLNYLLRKSIISQHQYDLLYPASGIPDLNSFDITLLSCLLRNLHPTKKPGDAVWNAPVAGDTSVEADISRIRETRNVLFGHKTASTLPDIEFNNETARLRTVLIRMIGNTPSSALSVQDVQNKIEHVLNDPLELDKHSMLLDRLEQWYRMDIPQHLHQMNEKLSGISETVERIEGELQNTRTIGDTGEARAVAKGMQLTKVDYVQSVDIRWKQGSMLGIGGDKRQHYCVYDYKDSNGALLPVYVQAGWDAPHTLTVDSKFQYGMNDGVFFIVYHDKNQRPFQHRFVQNLQQKAIYTANTWLREGTGGLVDLSWAVGDYLHDF